MSLTASRHGRRVAPHRAPAEAPPPQATSCSSALGAALVARRHHLQRSPARCPDILFALGLALGFVLFHSRFGFTSAWRQLVAVRQGKALRAHMLMLAVACTLFAPILATQASFGDVPAAPVAGTDRVRPVRRLVPVRRRHAARRLVRLRHAVRDRQRPDRDPADARPGSSSARSSAPALPVVDQRPAQPRAGVARGHRSPATPAPGPISLAVMAAIVGLTYLLGRRAPCRPLEQPPVARGAGRASAAPGRCGWARCCSPA